MEACGAPSGFRESWLALCIFRSSHGVLGNPIGQAGWVGSEETEWYQRVTQGRLGKAVARGTEGDKGIKEDWGRLWQGGLRGTKGHRGAPSQKARWI